MRCIFVLDLFWKITAKNVLKSRVFVVTFKANRRNDQVQGIIDSTLFYNVSSDHTLLIFQFLGHSCVSSREMTSCRRHYLKRDSFRFISRKNYRGGVLLRNDHSVTREYM